MSIKDILAVWSESSLSALWVASLDSDQIAGMLRLTYVVAVYINVCCSDGCASFQLRYWFRIRPTIHVHGIRSQHRHTHTHTHAWRIENAASCIRALSTCASISALNRKCSLFTRVDKRRLYNYTKSFRKRHLCLWREDSLQNKYNTKCYTIYFY